MYKRQTNDIRYENNPLTSGKIRSIAIDSAHNVSSIAIEMVDVDFSATGIKELSATRATVYPNPAHEHITIELDFNAQAAYQIIDALGKTIVQGKIDGGTKQVRVDVSSLAKGQYHVVIQSSDYQQTFKLIKH